MELSKKLQIPPGSSLYLVNAPEDLKLNVPLAKSASGAAVLVFAADSKALKTDAKAAISAAYKSDELPRMTRLDRTG